MLFYVTGYNGLLIIQLTLFFISFNVPSKCSNVPEILLRKTVLNILNITAVHMQCFKTLWL